MIEMKCPACGAEGRAPKDKINTRLVCKKCLRVFHLTPSGRAVAGEPPQVAVPVAKVADTTEKLELALDFDRWSERFRKFVFSPKLLAALGAIIVLGAGYLFMAVFRSETLETRASRLAKATVNGDLSTLLDLSATGTSEDVVKWYIAIQPQCVDLKKTLQSPPAVEVVVNKQDDVKGTADVTARVASEEALGKKRDRVPDETISTFALDKIFELPLSLTSEGLEGWRLDGKRTLEALPKTPLIKLQTH
jgi:hypothetical protein